MREEHVSVRMGGAWHASPRPAPPCLMRAVLRAGSYAGDKIVRWVHAYEGAVLAAARACVVPAVQRRPSYSTQYREGRPFYHTQYYDGGVHPL